MKRKGIFLTLVVAMALLLPAANAQVTLPWSENFDSYTTDGGTAYPNGWTRLTPFVVNGSTVRPNFWVFSSGTHGTALNLNGSTSGTQASGTSGTMQIATPLIPAPLNTLEVSFEVSGYDLKMYAAPDTSDATTWVLIGTYSSQSLYSWSSFEVQFGSVTGVTSDTGFIVFAGDYGSSNYCSARLDNLYVASLNGCDKPANVSVEQITPTGALVTWEAVAGVTDYRVSYDTVNDIANAMSVDVSSGTSTTLQNLEPGTQYYVWVQSLCSETSVSDGRTATFSTQLTCYSLVNVQQVSAGFDAASFAWEFDNRGYNATSVWTVLRDLDDPDATIEEESTSETSHMVSFLDGTHSYEIDFYTVCGDDTAQVVTIPVVFKVCGQSDLALLGGNHDMHPVPAGYNYGYTQMMYPAEVFLDMDTIRGLALHRALMNQSSAASITRTLSIWMHNTSDTSHNSAVPVTGMTQVANDSSYTFPVQEWDTIYFSTPFVYTPGSNVIVTIDDNTGTHGFTSYAQWMWHEQSWKTQYKNDDATNTNPASPSSLTHTQRCPDMRFVGNCNNDLSCVAPIVAVGAVDSMNAVITWVETSTNGYKVEYRTTGAATWTVADTAYASPYTIEGLQPAMHYEVRLGVLCENEVRYSDVAAFETECAIMHLPFHFTQTDMCAAADNGFAPCWNWSQYFYKGRLTNSHRGYVRNVDLNQWFMLPAVAEPLSGAKLRTWVECGTPEKFRVGIASLADCSDVVWLDTVQLTAGDPNTSHHDYTVYLDDYTGTGNRVVVSPIVSNDFSYVYFFDFHIEPIEECRPVQDLTLDSASASTLSVSWTPRGAATEWEVLVDGVVVDTVSDDYVTVGGLDAYTLYTVGVRPICSEGTSTTVTGDFRTLCSGEQCSFIVVMHSSLGTGSQGAKLQILADSALIGEIWMLDGSVETHTYSVCAGMTVDFKWLPGNDDAACSFEILNAVGDTLFYSGPGVYTLSGIFYSTDTICGGSNPGPGPGPGPNPENYTVTVSCSPVQGGSVTGAGTFASGTQVTLRATSNSGYHFAGWSNGETDSVYSFTLTADIALTANFAANGGNGIAVADGAAFVLAPNPASHIVTVAGFDGKASVSILDLNGREVYRREGVTENVKVDVSAIAEGVYFVHVVTPQAVAIRRLVVK